ncbi:MAG: 6,7-dimethyl-8-ribityllumazine synthase [Bacteroidales bacterium]|nr:6,7-dimethyl-8-ribityllumazine synthase [Candidatus Physcousia equi]
MATAFHNLSSYDPESVPNAEAMCFGIVVSEWNEKITAALANGAVNTLVKHGAERENIKVLTVPGSFELVYGASQMVKSGIFDAIIAIGCVVRGDTPHFDYICEGTTQGLADLNKDAKVPVIYGLLTCNTMEQAEMRAGGSLGNKGDECAITAIKMVDYKTRLHDACQDILARRPLPC